VTTRQERATLRERQELFKVIVCEGATCAAADSGVDGIECDGLLEAHHVIKRQTLRREGADEWDSRNGLPLCMRHHYLVTMRKRRLTTRNLRPENIEFALATGLDWALEREVVGYEPA
jgi:hypothetical protein